MDSLTFIAEVTKSLAWPIVTTVGLFLFRLELKRLLSRLRKGKIGDAELEFEKEVEVLTEKNLEGKQPPRLTERENAIAAADPNGAVIKTWLEIEHSARKAFHKFGIAYTRTPHTPFLSCLRELENGGVISFEESMLVRELQILRNRAVHEQGFFPSVESVQQYIELSKIVIAKLEAAVAASTANPAVQGTLRDKAAQRP
ncbi:hypothetical protein [Nitrosomonas sp.]|uniref:hypothetical protein n=1 Tax=Nitrosomonas sp. TaxID=42353 RepID=UPI0035B182E5